MTTIRIFLTGKMQGNSEIEWRISPPPPAQDEPVQDGDIQDAIDYGAELQELLDWRDDEEFNRRGC